MTTTEIHDATPRSIVRLDPDHPGFRDAAYRERRDAIARLALDYLPGEPIPEAPYSAEEHDLWREIWLALDLAHREHACVEYLACAAALDLPRDRIPQLAEVTARLQQVRSELPPQAEPPVVDVQRTDRPYASFYLSFTSDEKTVPELTDWLSRTLQPQLATIEGVQRVSNSEGGQPIAMRVWIDPDRLAAVNLAPGDVYAALQRNNYLAAVGQTKGNLVPVKDPNLGASLAFENY